MMKIAKILVYKILVYSVVLVSSIHAMKRPSLDSPGWASCKVARTSAVNNELSLISLPKDPICGVASNLDLRSLAALIRTSKYLNENVNVCSIATKPGSSVHLLLEDYKKCTKLLHHCALKHEKLIKGTLFVQTAEEGSRLDDKLKENDSAFNYFSTLHQASLAGDMFNYLQKQESTSQKKLASKLEMTIADKILFHRILRHTVFREKMFLPFQVIELTLKSEATLQDKMSFYLKKTLPYEEVSAAFSNLLCLIIKDKNAPVVQKTLKHHGQFEGSLGLLELLCELGNVDIMDKFLSVDSRGVDYSESRKTALYFACEHENFDLVKYLLEKGASLNIDMEKKPFFIACEKGNVAIVKALLDSGADYNSVNLLEETPLHVACDKNHALVVHELLAKGVDFNRVDKSKMTPLHIASSRNSEIIVKMLLSLKADPNIANFMERTPLYTACENGNQKIVEMLLIAGADTNMCGQYDRNLLQVAYDGNNEGVLEALLNGGVNPDMVDVSGKTLLQRACENGNQRMVERLLAAGADYNKRDLLGRTLPLIAHQYGYLAIMKMLLDKGARFN